MVVSLTVSLVQMTIHGFWRTQIDKDLELAINSVQMTILHTLIIMDYSYVLTYAQFIMDMT